MKVLIIEDDPGIQRVLSHGFRAKSVTVRAVRNPKQALQILSGNDYKGIVMDLSSQAEGEKMVRKIRKVSPRTPILVLTAMCSVETRKRLFEAGADDFLEKPFSFEELYARINAILRRLHRGELTEYIRLGDIRLLPEKRTAMKGGKEITLRAKEYALLIYMMKYPNQVLSRQALMENVWGYFITVSFNTVDSHIFNLRRKIDRGSGFRYIRTIHGIGYMFVPPTGRTPDSRSSGVEKPHKDNDKNEVSAPV